MRRFKSPNERIFGEHRNAGWGPLQYLLRGDETSSTAAMDQRWDWDASSIGFAHFAGVNTATRSVFGPDGSTGARTIGSGCGWFRAAGGQNCIESDTASVGYTLGLSLRVVTAGTMALLSYDASSSFSTCSVPEYRQAVGLLMNANGGLRYIYDSSASISLGLNVGYVDLTGPNQITLVTGFEPGVSRTLVVYVNGKQTYTSASLLSTPPGVTTYYEAGTLSLGVMQRLGTTASIPYTSSGGVACVSDVFLRADMVGPAWARQAYAYGVRPWDEYSLIKSGNYKVHYRAVVEDPDGSWVDLSNHWGRNWVKNISLTERVDGGYKKATVRLVRYYGGLLNTSPLDQSSALNVSAAGTFDELLEARRKILVETAITPVDWTIQGWEWSTEHEGFIDTIAWGSDEVTLECPDRNAPLTDTFQLDPVDYAYFTSVKRAEDHMQDIIDDNTPAVPVHTGTVSYGYKGGAINLWTPGSTGWAIRHDEVLADTVLNNLVRIADQTAWDLRWRWFEPDGAHRLTYFDPNRTRTVSGSTNYFDAGRVGFRTTIPHGLQPRQKAYAYTTGAEGYVLVDEVVNTHFAWFSSLEGTYFTPSLHSGGDAVLTYAEVYNFEPREVLSVDRGETSIADVRNLISLKFNRESTAVSIAFGPFHSPAGGAYGVANVALGQGIAFEPGDEFTVTGTSPTFAETGYTFTVATVGRGVVTDATLILTNGGGTVAQLISQEPIPGVVSAATVSLAGFRSDVIKFKQTFVCDTPSIQKYGLRAAQIAEGTTTNISAIGDANNLANRVLSDLKEPNVSLGIKIKYLPQIELHDWIGVEADPMRRWSTQFTAAVTEISHNLTPDGCTTSLGLRYSAPTKGAQSAQRLLVSPARPAIPTRLRAGLAFPGGNSQPQASVVGTKSIRVMVPPKDGSTDERYRRVDHLEVHVSTTTSGFIPNSNTLAGKFTGGYGEITKLSDGSDILSATQHFTKVRWVDVYGNPSTWTSITTQYPRINPFPEAYSCASLGTSASHCFRFQLTDCVAHPGMWISSASDNAGVNTSRVRTAATFDTDTALTRTTSPTSQAYTNITNFIAACSAGFIAPLDGIYKITSAVGLHRDLTNDTTATTGYRIHIWNRTRAYYESLTSSLNGVWHTSTSYSCHPTGVWFGGRCQLAEFEADLRALKGDLLSVWIEKVSGGGLSPEVWLADPWNATAPGLSAASGSLAHCWTRFKLLNDD